MSDQKSTDTIQLSRMTEALLKALATHTRKKSVMEGELYNVSKTVSFFGFVYERMRNAIEFNEEHLIRRIAITRILKRRLAINPSGDREGENLVRELLWGRYVPEEGFSVGDVSEIQHIITTYIAFYKAIQATHSIKKSSKLGDTILELMSCEIEQHISQESSRQEAAFLYYFYQTLKNKVQIPHVSDDLKDAYFFVASERALAKNDSAFIYYHLFVLHYGELHTYSEEALREAAKGFHIFLNQSKRAVRNSYNTVLVRFAKKQVPPFKILYELLKKHEGDASKILSNKEALLKEVEEICQVKYSQTADKLRSAAIKSIIYIFCTKMIFVLIFEIPLSQLIYGTLEISSILINTFFPPTMMGIIVSITNPPSSKNTERIYNRIVDIIDENPTFETQKVTITKNKAVQKPTLFALFSMLYLCTFSLVFGMIYFALDTMGFNLVSKSIFIFFICVVAFFGYRIRQTAKEYVLESSSNILVTAVTFLFLPILFVGKLLSEQVSRINVFIILFDYFIEAPFKFIIDIIEEWTRFIRDRKDELV